MYTLEVDEEAETRPDTRLPKSRAGGQGQCGQRNKNTKKVKSDRPTDRRTKRVVESRARDLKGSLI